ncbi:MAG: PEP-CTERM sorting domain-containing protein [Planctomycetota bacterium]|jgi:hypothetical protein
MMKKISVLAAFLCVCMISQAGIIVDTFDCTFPDDPTQDNHAWNYDYETDTLTLAENYTHTGSDSVNMAVETDEDPLVHIVKTVTNSNGHDWTSYTLTLNDATPGVSFVDSAFSDVFTSAALVGNVITFSGETVAIGETVNLEFDILIADAGSFGWCVTQQAIPEPATLVMLGLGALSLLRWKK